MKSKEAKDLIIKEIDRVRNHKVQLSQGCVACHIIMVLKNNLQKPEQDSADLLSEILTDDLKLNERFIETVEQIHMTERNLGGAFALRQRDSKDAYLETYFKNVIEELESDLVHTDLKIVLRKLILSYLGLYLAQTLGIDYHAATEELYYLLRKDEQKNRRVDGLISKISGNLSNR